MRSIAPLFDNNPTESGSNLADLQPKFQKSDRLLVPCQPEIFGENREIPAALLSIKNNDAMYLLIFFGAQIHSESYGFGCFFEKRAIGVVNSLIPAEGGANVEEDAKIFYPADASPSCGFFWGKGILRMAMPPRESFIVSSGIPTMIRSPAKHPQDHLHLYFFISYFITPSPSAGP